MQTLLSSLRHRFIQAPMAGAQDAQLAIAVCQAGGLGSLPAAMYSPEQLDAQLSTFRQAVGNAPVNVNFFCTRNAQSICRTSGALAKRVAALLRRIGRGFEPSGVARHAPSV